MYGVAKTLIEQTEAEDIYTASINLPKAFFYGLLVQIIFSLIIAAFIKKDKPVENLRIMDISVVVPSFNESESLPELFAWIDRVMNNISFDS